jgi:Transcriptional regulator, AbiEi antitoxin
MTRPLQRLNVTKAALDSIRCVNVREAMTTLSGFTADQWGLVTSAQATGAGVDRTTIARLVEAGLLDHIRRGVYAVLAAPEDPLRETRAAWLQLNPAVPGWERPLIDPDGGIVSHTTAARVHDLGDMLVGRAKSRSP